MPDDRWYGAKTVFEFGGMNGITAADEVMYEERINVLKASDFEAALQRAESIARRYAADSGSEFLGFVEVYEMFDEVEDGAEIYSMTRPSRLTRNEYLDRCCRHRPVDL